MADIKVCLCEPFILPGILPTLGSPTLKGALNEVGVTSRIFYPSFHLFAENKYYNNDIFLKCISDIPLQFSEFLYNQGNIDEGIVFLTDRIGIEARNEFEEFLNSATHVLFKTAENICSTKAKVLSYSLTFGDYNFAFNLFRVVKSIKKDMVIVVGGSMCTPQLSKELMKQCPEIDYVVCDEDIRIYQDLITSIIAGKSFQSSNITSKEKTADNVNKIKDLNHLPCPDFSDFLREVDLMGLNKESVIVPYEISRGCWWGEKKSCAMCGYFGYQKCFLIKNPEKVIEDIKKLHYKYGINYIRFTDLVEPHRQYLQQLEVLNNLGMNFFWELRPNITEQDIDLIRSMGVFYSQIGLESLSTAELEHIHKGTTAINNIYLLVLFMTYKIRIDWNYLYGFADDIRSWYEQAIEIMPLLHHLFPPDLRQVWINRESRIFNESNKEELHPVGSKIFHKGFSDEIEVFYQTEINEGLSELYEKLADEIAEWKRDFFAGHQLCVVYDFPEGIHVMRDFGKEEHFYMTGFEAKVYELIYRPTKIDKIVAQFKTEDNRIEEILSKFVEKKIAVFLDDKYLALATRSSRYRWKKYNLLHALFEK